MSFEQAPVTKGLMIGLGASSLCAGILDVKHYLHLQLVPHISKHHQYWRLFLHHFAYADSSDLFIALLILYKLGVQVERQFGSVKYASFAVVSILVATIVEFIVLLLLHRTGLNVIHAGPNTLIFSIAYQYSRLVPTSYDLRLFGVPLNNKSFLYAPALHLALGHYPSSVITAFIGILTGQLYRSDLANLKTYRLPPSIVRVSEKLLLPLVGNLRPPPRALIALPDATPATSTPPAGASESTPDPASGAPAPPPTGTSPVDGPATQAADTPTNGTGLASGSTSVMREWVDELTGRTQNAAAGLRVPPEAEIAQVMAMFPDMDRSVVVAALQRSANAESAVATLLSGQT